MYFTFKNNMISLRVSSVGKLSLLILLSVQLSWTAPARGKTTKWPVAPSGGPRPSMEKLITERFKALPKAQLMRSKLQAAKRLQSNLVPVLRALSESGDKRMPARVKASAKSISNALKNGQLTQSVVKALPSVMTNYPSKDNPANQLDSILRAILPFSPRGSQSPLDALTKFIRTNLNGVNTLLVRILGAVPDLLKGVVQALVGPLDAVTDTVGGTVDSVGLLLGNLLQG